MQLHLYCCGFFRNSSNYSVQLKTLVVLSVEHDSEVSKPISGAVVIKKKSNCEGAEQLRKRIQNIEFI